MLSINGKKLEVQPTDRKTRAFDSNGRQLSMLTQAWVLKQGNVVDVVLGPPGKRKGALPTIREIRLVKGTLRDVPRYLDEVPAYAR